MYLSAWLEIFTLCENALVIIDVVLPTMLGPMKLLLGRDRFDGNRTRRNILVHVGETGVISSYVNSQINLAIIPAVVLKGVAIPVTNLNGLVTFPPSSSASGISISGILAVLKVRVAVEGRNEEGCRRLEAAVGDLKLRLSKGRSSGLSEEGPRQEKRIMMRL